MSLPVTRQLYFLLNSLLFVSFYTSPFCQGNDLKGILYACDLFDGIFFNFLLDLHSCSHAQSPSSFQQFFPFISCTNDYNNNNYKTNVKLAGAAKSVTRFETWRVKSEVSEKISNSHLISSICCIIFIKKLLVKLNFGILKMHGFYKTNKSCGFFSKTLFGAKLKTNSKIQII